LKYFAGHRIDIIPRLCSVISFSHIEKTTTRRSGFLSAKMRILLCLPVMRSPSKIGRLGMSRLFPNRRMWPSGRMMMTQIWSLYTGVKIIIIFMF
jgi:hypothetical protein